MVLRDTRGRFISPAKFNLFEQAQPKPVVVPSPVLSGDSPKVEFGSNYHTAQIYSKGYEFAFMSRVEGIWKQICTFVYCKDFLHDLVWAAINKTKWSIYGFHYDSSKDLPLEQEFCAFAFRNTDFAKEPAKFHEKMPACLDFLNQVEKVLGFQPSKIWQVEHQAAPCWLIVSDKRWQIAPPLLGIFTLFIRLGTAHTLGESYEETLKKCREHKIKLAEAGVAGSNDPGYIQHSWKGIEALFAHKLDNFYPTIEENYPADLPKRGVSLHDALGPVNWTKGHARKAMPQWYKHL